MDKETGVEQTQSEWSDGLQQFLQLKHGMKWTPISLKAIFMSNIGYFSEFEGRMYGLTGTLGSTAECDLLRHVFGVDFFRLPRFRQRFCIQHEPIIANSRQAWVDQMQQVVVSIASTSNPNQQRAVLVICENIESADSIYERLQTANTNTQILVIKYVSSFDESFKNHQEILPGQVIIATNLAGRGTDLKPSQSLVANGGLHVIIGFLPPNARVEAQAEGRTARAGQPGSFQFVIHQVENDAASNRQAKLIDPYGRLLELKSKRDDDERLRLDNIRQESLPKIKLEEKLFHEFYKKCVAPLEEIKSHLHLQQEIRKIMRRCLSNRWALWLDENAGVIEKAHHDPVVDAKLNDNFNYLTMSVQSSDVESIASSPSEWMMFARFYEESSLPDKAVECYRKVASIEPKWCENALLDRARLVLAESADFEKKMIAKGYLKRARKLIDDRIQVLVSLHQQVDLCLNRQMERGSALCHKRFEEQINNQIRLLRIHSSQIDNLLGVPFKCALAAILPTENDQHMDQVIELLGNFMKPLRYSKKAEKISFDWPPFVAHCREPLMELVKNGQNCKLSDFEDAIGQVEQNLWTSLISVYIDKGQETGGGKIIKAHQYVGEIPDTILSKGHRLILPGWLKFHDAQEFSLVSSTLGIDDDDQLKKLEKWLEDKQVLQVADNCFRHRLLKQIPSMDQDPDAQLVEGVALSSCADVVASWFSSPIVETNGNEYVLRPLFDERKKKLAKQFLDYLIDVGVVKDPAIRFPSAGTERSREEMKQDWDKIKDKIDSLYGLNQLAKLFYGTDEKVEEKKEDVKALSNLEQNFYGLLPPIVSSLVVPVANEVSTAFNYFNEINRQRQEAKVLKKKKEKLSAELMQAIGIHLGQLKTLAQVKSSFCSLYAALPPPGNDPSSPTDEIHQFNHQHLDRVLLVDEYVSRWDWRIGVVALFGVAQLVGAMAFPFFSGGLVGEGINDLMFAFQCLQSPGSFSLKSYLVDKGKSLALTAVTMGLGAARLVKACGGTLKQAGKMMLRFNGTLKAWYQAGKHVLIQCANIISSSVIGQAVSHSLTWLNKFILEQVLERIKSSLFNNSFLRPAFAQLKGSMKSLMTVMVKSGKSAGEASQIIRQVLNGAKNKLTANDWFTELRTNASSIASRMMRIFNDSTAGLSNLQGSYVSEYRSHALIGNDQGSITAAANAGTIEKAIKVSQTIIDYGRKAAEVKEKIDIFLGVKCETVVNCINEIKMVTKLATHGTTYVGDLNSALQDELRALKTKSQQEPAAGGKSSGELSKEEAERFEELINETEGEIQSSIMKTTLDTIQTAWLQPMIQLKIEGYVSRIGSKLVQKYCPSLLPEGFGNKGNQSKNSGDEDVDQWIDQMGKGKLSGPVEMQNAADRFSIVIINKYLGIEGNNFSYYPDGNPYSDKPVILLHSKDNEDGSKHVVLIMPDGTEHDIVPDPSDPPNRCFPAAISKALGHPSIDYTIEQLKNHAKGNERARFMSKLGVNQRYQHLQVGKHREIEEGDTIYKVDKLGRTVQTITTATERKQKRNADPKKVRENKKLLNFQKGDVYSHGIGLSNGGTDNIGNISRGTKPSNQYLFRKHEMNFEAFSDYNKKSESPEKITRVVTNHYQHSVSEILRMERKGQSPDRYKIKGYQHDFCTGPRDNPTNLYLSGFIPNWIGPHTRKFNMENSNPKRMKRSDAGRKAANTPYVRGPMFEKFFRNANT